MLAAIAPRPGAGDRRIGRIDLGDTSGHRTDRLCFSAFRVHTKSASAAGPPDMVIVII